MDCPICHGPNGKENECLAHAVKIKWLHRIMEVIHVNRGEAEEEQARDAVNLQALCRERSGLESVALQASVKPVPNVRSL